MSRLDRAELPRLRELPISETSDHVVVDHAGRLHERVANRRPDELEAAPDEVFAHGHGLGRDCRTVGHAPEPVVDRLAACELPDVTVEGPVLFLYIEEVLGVDDCSGHLRTVADDASIGKEARVISGSIPGDTPGSKSWKARRKFSRLLMIVCQLRPACMPSSAMYSNSLRSSCRGEPHS